MRDRRRYTSVKPGRGPSFMGGIGSVISIIFGIFWTAMASQMTRKSPFGGPVSLFPLFGILFILAGVANAIYNFRNATAKDRYSVVDITDSESEVDPLNERYGRSDDVETRVPSDQDRHAVVGDVMGEIVEPDVSHESEDGRKRFCPYCGKSIVSDFRFCPHCGRELAK